jgi:hypothetical protein
MSRLLALPRELRDRIIEFAITHQANAPTTLTDVGRRIELEDIEYFSLTSGRGVQYAADVPSTSPLALLAVNRQIRAETCEAIRRLSLTCECDVIIANEDSLYVTWTYVPPIFKPLKAMRPNLDRDEPEFQEPLRDFKVIFTIRMHGIFTPTAAEPRSGFEDLLEGPNNDIVGPGRVICGFCALFERFLRVGPGTYPVSSRNFDRNETIGYAQLNILTPPSAEQEGLLPRTLGPHHAPEYRRNHDSRALIHPETLLEMLTNWFWVSEIFEDEELGPKPIGLLLCRVYELSHAVDGSVHVTFSNPNLDGNWEADQEREVSPD